MYLLQCIHLTRHLDLSDSTCKSANNESLFDCQPSVGLEFMKIKYHLFVFWLEWGKVDCFRLDSIPALTSNSKLNGWQQHMKWVTTAHWMDGNSTLNVGQKYYKSNKRTFTNIFIHAIMCIISLLYNILSIAQHLVYTYSVCVCVELSNCWPSTCTNVSERPRCSRNLKPICRFSSFCTLISGLVKWRGKGSPARKRGPLPMNATCNVEKRNVVLVVCSSIHFTHSLLKTAYIYTCTIPGQLIYNTGLAFWTEVMSHAIKN